MCFLLIFGGLLITGAKAQSNGILISGIDRIHGFSLKNGIAAYVYTEGSAFKFHSLLFDGTSFGRDRDRLTFSGVSKATSTIRGLNYYLDPADNPIMSYMIFDGSSTYLIVCRPGSEFMELRRVRVSGADVIRGWSWDGGSEAYYIVLRGGNSLLIRQHFDGTSFGSIISTTTFKSGDVVRGYSRLEGEERWVEVVDGKSMLMGTQPSRGEDPIMPTVEPEQPDVPQPDAFTTLTTMAQQLDALDRSIVVVKSLRWAGAYIDANDRASARVTDCARTKLFDALWSKMIVHHVRGNIICLESMRYRDHYLHKGADNTLYFTYHLDIPKNNEWATFSIEGNSLDNVGIRSQEGDNRWLNAHHTGYLYATYFDGRPTDSWGKWSIQFPGGEVTEGYETVASLQNNTSGPIEKTYVYRRGISHSTSQQETVTQEKVFEVKYNLGTPAFNSGSLSLGAKFSNTWRNERRETFNASTEVRATYTVPPHSTIYVKQLLGKYGPLEVGTNHLMFSNTP